MMKKRSPLKLKRRGKSTLNSWRKRPSSINLKYRSSSLSKILRRLITMNLLSRRLRRLLKRLLRKLNLRKLMTTHSSLQIHRPMNNGPPIKKRNPLKSPLKNSHMKRKLKKFIY